MGRRKKLNTFFFLKLFGPLRDIPAKSRDVPPKSLVLGFEGHTKIFGPTLSRGRPPPLRKISGPKSLGLCSFCFPELSGGNKLFSKKGPDAALLKPNSLINSPAGCLRATCLFHPILCSGSLCVWVDLFRAIFQFSKEAKNINVINSTSCGPKFSQQGTNRKKTLPKRAQRKICPKFSRITYMIKFC